MNLAQKKCIPCSGSVKAFDRETAQKYLKELNGWDLSNDAKWIFKEFKFKNFLQALEFVNKVALVSEAEQHHPNIDFTWGHVKISIQTHKINGLFDNDFILAAKIDSL
jgi:4a-hydroxytetrahydrobiopterin dehydratase